MTFYRSVNDLPDFEDYSMKSRTYRYFKGDVLYPFGYGLSYTDFEYQSMSVGFQKKGEIEVVVKIKNAGKYDGDEVVQIYIQQSDSLADQPIISLAGFKRVFIAKGETAKVKLIIPEKQLRYYDPESGEYKITLGGYSIKGGRSSADLPFIMMINYDM
ncbi:MAG: fibronectin type III-like domain-contianing protein [Saprospiraceae bacterium]|nr:fibronectin type III-like domain-contianing protein [Saprospiraceae bacterium]